jgi:putative nucleotidyltransferase with HDIG domain
MTRAGHLVRRFVGSLRPRRLTDADFAFVRAGLTPAELRSFEQLGPADRTESVATGRATADALGSGADPRWIAAALLHDVGKAETDLGPVGRSGATVAALIAGEHRARRWSGNFGRYVNHDELGARRLEVAGARPEAVAWARAHHRRALWPASGIPPEICEILAAADGEPRPR